MRRTNVKANHFSLSVHYIHHLSIEWVRADGLPVKEWGSAGIVEGTTMEAVKNAGSSQFRSIHNLQQHAL